MYVLKKLYFRHLPAMSYIAIVQDLIVFSAGELFWLCGLNYLCRFVQSSYAILRSQKSSAAEYTLRSCTMTIWDIAGKWHKYNFFDTESLTSIITDHSGHSMWRTRPIILLKFSWWEKQLLYLGRNMLKIVQVVIFLGIEKS